MEIIDYTHLQKLIEQYGLSGWGNQLESITQQFIINNPHGRTGTWEETLASLPNISIDERLLDNSAIKISTKQSIDFNAVKQTLLSLYPWRKGPYDIHGIYIDTEWRSDLKWDRLKDKITPLKDRRVLDIGCGNGYHLWRMLGDGASCAIGVDPMRLYAVQFQAIRHFVGADLPATVLPVGIEQLPMHEPAFETIFSMGVLYHRRKPLEHIEQLKSLLVPGGELVLETLIMEDDTLSLSGKDRYARMRNVWHIPTISALTEWLQQARMHEIKVIDISPTTTVEQRKTEWMPFESLQESLDPENSGKTIEGHPGPVRAVLTARTAEK